MTATTRGELVKTDLIDIPESYERKSSLVEDDAIKRSIEKYGIQQDLVLFENGDRFTLGKGSRRLLIARELKIPLVPAIIVATPQEANPESYRNKLRFILTKGRQDLKPSQRAEFINWLLENFKVKDRDPMTTYSTTRAITRKEIADMLGIDPGSITNYLAVLKYDKRIVAMIDTGELNSHAARSFDGLKPEAQVKVFNSLRREFKTLAGGKLHRLVRQKFNPRSHAELYVAPEKTIEKLQRREKGRKSKRRPRLTRDEKTLLAKDLELKEVELTEGKEELLQLKKEITLATTPVRAIMRSKALRELIPADTLEEMERFADVYC